MKLKKLFALLLVFAFLFTIAPVATLAESESGGAPEIVAPSETPPTLVVPVEPTTPVAPVEPTTPVVPVEPTTPVVPVEPTTPVVPVEPTTPVAPVEPTTPVAPVEPTTPVVPVEPTTPVVPVEPTTPVVPVEPIPPIVPPNPNVLYDGMTLEELYNYVNACFEANEDESSAYLAKMQENASEAYEKLLAYADSLREEEIPETVDFTDAGPFHDPVDLSDMQISYGFAASNLSRSVSSFALMDMQAFAEPQPLPKGLQLTKTAQSKGDGTYQITMEAWATGEVIQTTEPKPVDIILVLDQSSSMSEDFNGNNSGDKYSRQAAMKASVVKFINQVKTKAEGMEAGKKHRVALVTFDKNAYALSKLQYEYDVLINKVNALQKPTSNYTMTDEGLTKAKIILDTETTPANGRQKVVILFTDGLPSVSGDSLTLSVADQALASAKLIKDTGATLYTVGIFGGADKDRTEPDQGKYFSETDAANRFMNYASSNFKNATRTGLKDKYWYGLVEVSDFTRPNRTADNYYLTASNAGALDDIFQNIAKKIDKPGIALGADTVVNDFMSEYFVVDQTSVQISTSAYKGGGKWDSPAPIKNDIKKTATDNNVSVTGFDFTGNFVSETEKTDKTFGKKLIITLKATKKKGFFGGNEVPTNTGLSGIYQGNEIITGANFPVPKVDVPIDYQIASQNQAVYLGNQAKLEELLQYPSGYEPKEWNNRYVKIEYELKDGAKLKGTYTIDPGSASGSWIWKEKQTATPVLSDDTKYTLSCKVSPVNSANPAQNPEISAQTPTVYVYKPQLTLTLSNVWADYQKPVDLAGWALGEGTSKVDNYKPVLSDTWVVSEAGRGVRPSETAPGINAFSNFTYEFAQTEATGDAVLSGGSATTGKKDTNFTVKLKSYKINDCEESFNADCKYVTTQYPNNQKYFTLHTNRFNLKVTKTDDAPAAYGPQSFLFHMTSENEGLKLSFALARGMDQKLSMEKTMVGLLCGQSYTVSEDENWSWRYDAGTKGIDASATRNAEPSKSDPATPPKTLAFVNTLKNKQWLSGSTGIANIFGSTK